MSSRTAAPSTAWARARADRASVTSFASSAAGPPSGLADIGNLQRCPVRRVGDPPYQHGADPVAAALRALGGQLDAVQPDLGAGDRHAPQVLGEQAADRVDVVVLQLDVQELGELVEVQPGADPERPVVELVDQRSLDVVLVRDLPDDLL